MPRLIVTKPFHVQFERGTPRRHFTAGEHPVTQAELEDWFVQACIAEGRAEMLKDEPAAPAPVLEVVAPGAPAAHDEFLDAMGLDQPAPQLVAGSPGQDPGQVAPAAKSAGKAAKAAAPAKGKGK